MGGLRLGGSRFEASRAKSPQEDPSQPTKGCTIIPATRKAEMGRMEVPGQPGQKGSQDPILTEKARHDGVRK
jgi:hypothetical protein